MNTFFYCREMKKQLELAVTRGQTRPILRLGISYWCTWSFKFYHCHWINKTFGLLTGLSFTLVNSDENPCRYAGRWVLISSAHIVLRIPEHFKRRSTSFTDGPRRTCGLFLHRSWRRIADSLAMRSSPLDKPRQSAGPRAHMDLRLLFLLPWKLHWGKRRHAHSRLQQLDAETECCILTAMWRTTQKRTQSLCCHKVQTEWTFAVHVGLT